MFALLVWFNHGTHLGHPLAPDQRIVAACVRLDGQRYHKQMG